VAFFRGFVVRWEAWSTLQRCLALIGLTLIVVAAAICLDRIPFETRKIVAAAVIGLSAFALSLLTLGNVRERPARPVAPSEKSDWEPELMLAEVDLRGATLPDAHLEGSEITDAVLTDANLSGATLAASLLAGSNMQGVDLRGADLRGADLRGADLREAKTAGAQFWGATYDDQTQWPEGQAHPDAIHIEAAEGAE
jgi:uncharacterized protein YjbI with pentapeptide repeats